MHKFHVHSTLYSLYIRLIFKDLYSLGSPARLLLMVLGSEKMQELHMRLLPYSIFVFLSKWCQISYLNLVCKIFYFYLWLHVEIGRLWEFHHFTNWFKLFLYRYICHIFGHAQFCVNDYFLTNYYFAKEDYFRVSLLFSKDNWWGREPMASQLSCWVFRRFNLLRHIYVGFTNMSFCERLSYNTFKDPPPPLLRKNTSWYKVT